MFVAAGRTLAGALDTLSECSGHSLSIEHRAFSKPCRAFDAELSRPGVLTPGSFQRKDWPSTSSWDMASEPLEGPAC